MVTDYRLYNCSYRYKTYFIYLNKDNNICISSQDDSINITLDNSSLDEAKDYIDLLG